MISQKRLLIVGGKGGVGRTTIAAALGVLLARRGRRVLLAHVRCRRPLQKLLGAPTPIGTEVVPVDENLWAVNMDPWAAIHEMGVLVLRFHSVARAVLDNRIVRYFLKATPALQEYSMLGKAWYHTTETRDDGSNRFDTVIFDGPATGHLVSMLAIPQVILDTVPGGPLVRDARKSRELLSDPERTGFYIVTLAEEMPASEAYDLYRACRDQLAINVDGVLVNAVYPRDFADHPELTEALERLRHANLSPDLQALVGSGETVRRRRELNDHYVAELRRRIGLPLHELPHLFTADVGRAGVDALSRLLGEALLAPETAAPGG